MFKGKETKREERSERASSKSKAAYAKAEKKFEKEKYACGGKVKSGKK